MGTVRGIPEAAVQALQIKLQELDYKLLSLNLDKARSVSLNQREFGYTLRQDLWILLVLTIGDMEPMLYLIPSTVFATPGNIFLNNEQSQALHHFSTWEIKVFTRGIAELSIYSLDNIHTLRTGLDA